MVRVASDHVRRVLEVLTTDPVSAEDFEAFASATGNELLESSSEASAYRFLVRRLS